jgi:CheY-like chemotaxis protein
MRIDPDADRTVRVVADRQRLRQVALNLVANAIKYNRSGGTVDLGWSAQEDVVRVSVTDSGIGIRAEAQDRLFLPFERLSDDQAVEGTGLGLALSRSLITSMGGHMGATSTFGSGSTFWFELREGRQRDGSAYGEDRAGPTSRLRVLYVEDDLTNLRLVEEILADRTGIEVVSTLQGALALDLARQYHPDVVLLDLHLADIDGAEVLDHLTHDPETGHIPVIVISADASPDRPAELLARGAFAFATKPIDIGGFGEILDRALEAGSPSRRS